MAIEIKHYSFAKKDNYKWFFFGTNYLKLKKLEKIKGSNNRLSLTENISQTCKKEKKNYLNWIEKQRINFHDSLNWSMNTVSSRNNFNSNFFIYIIQFIALKNFIKINKISNIVVYTDRYFLVKFLNQNFKSEVTTLKNFFINALTYCEKFYFILKGILNYLKIFHFFIVHKFLAFKTKNKKTIFPSGEIYLFHDLISSEKINNSVVQSRYFGDYPDWLSKKKNVYVSSWFFRNIKNKFSFYKHLRNIKSFIPEDFLSIQDYIFCFANGLKSAFSINDKINYPELDIKILINIEKLNNLCSKSPIFFRYIPSINKWSKNIKKIYYFDHYQNQPYEHPIRYALSRLNLDYKSIGYYHSLHSEDYLAYQFHDNEWNSKIKPDILLCPNIICKNQLKQQGIPEKKIKVISDLQRKTINIKEIKENNNLLIVLSLFDEINYEILLKILSINNILMKKFKINIIIRPHPYSSIKRILKNIKLNKLPSNWSISNNSLEIDLLKSKSAVAMRSAIATDIVLNGNILITPTCELNLGENYLDFLTKKFEILRSIKIEDLVEQLKKIYVSKDKTLIQKNLEVKKYLQENFNPQNFEEIIV